MGTTVRTEERDMSEKMGGVEVLLGFMSGWGLLVPRPPGSRSQSPNFTTCCKQLVFIF